MAPPIDFTQPRDAREQQVRAFVAKDEVRGALQLTQCHGLTEEKQALFERLHKRDPKSTFQRPLVRDLEEARAAELAAQVLGDDELIDLLWDIARANPAAVRPHYDRISDEQIRGTLRAEGPDAWADQYRDAYLKDGDVGHIKKLGELATEHAADVLYRLGQNAPADHVPMIALAMELCGMFANDKGAAWASDAFRAYVVSRDESPHHFGKGLEHPVPVCSKCDTPAERLITIDHESTEDAFGLAVSPSFFWWRCSCDNGNLLFAGHEGAAAGGTKMSKGAVPDSPIPHGAWALDKAERSVVAAHPAMPGRAEHQVGGAPTWVRKHFNPRVPDIAEQRGMCFLASFDLQRIPLGWVTGATGIAYCFWDVETSVGVTQLQIDDGEPGLFGF